MLKLYHCPNARSMRSLWLLYELNIDFELIEMPFDQKYTRSPEYLSVHPLGRVPCLVHNETTLYESGAICQYLWEVFDKSDILGKTHKIISSGYHSKHFYRKLNDTISQGKEFSSKIKNMTQQKKIYLANLSIIPIKCDKGRVEKYISVQNIVSYI